MLNQSIIIGRIVKNPELLETESGKKYTNITLAVSRNYKNIDGEYETDFIPCTLWKGIAENAVETMLETINKAEAESGYTNEQMVAFVDPVMYAALMTSDKLQHSITVSDFEQGAIDVKVKELNGCAIIPVAADRMRTEYEFNDAGFEASADAGFIKAIVMPKSAASLVKKVDKVDIYSPDQVQDMDAYKINFRLYYDLFVTNNKKGLIFAISGE